jgi:hypothetical protein
MRGTKKEGLFGGGKRERLSEIELSKELMRAHCHASARLEEETKSKNEHSM